MKESFVIYTKYEEQISLLTDTQAGVLLRSLIKYQSGQTLPKMDGVTSMAFSFIKQQIDLENEKKERISKVRMESGKMGGRPVKRLANKGNKPKKPNGFSENQKNQMVFEESKETERLLKETTPLKESNKENITPVQENITPFCIFPQGNKKTDEDLFFERYPRYAKDKSKARTDIDYNRLLKEFDMSSYCRNFYTMKQINENYCLIVSGEFRDKPAREDSTEARAKRERFYSERKAKAQSIADKILNRFLQDEEFKRIHKRLRELELEIAKAEVAAENGSDKSKKELVKLTQEQGRLRQTRLVIIEKNGLSEEDLLPKWHCKKCSDTGYLANGAMCDCYKGD